MTKEGVLVALRAHRAEWSGFGVKSLALFGSVVRGEATASSDVDVLVEFEEGRRIGLLAFISLKQRLEDVLGCRVDLATPEALRGPARDRILREAVHAA